MPIDKRAERNGRQGVRTPLQEAMAVLDPDTMQSVPWDGETMGEIMFRGNITMKGYLKNPSATDKAFEGGWFHTGDLAVMQPDGYAKIRDRSKDIIISGGENISSIEVEETLYRHPAVLSAAVVAQPDEKWGETPCAFIELKLGASVDGGRTARVLPRAHGPVQGAEDVRISRDPEDFDREDPEVRAARDREVFCSDRVDRRSTAPNAATPATHETQRCGVPTHPRGVMSHSPSAAGPISRVRRTARRLSNPVRAIRRDPLRQPKLRAHPRSQFSDRLIGFRRRAGEKVENVLHLRINLERHIAVRPPQSLRQVPAVIQ